MSLQDPGSYRLPVILAVGLHVAVVVLIAFEWQRSSRNVPQPEPPSMTASLVPDYAAREKAKKEQALKEKQALEKAAREKAAKEKAAREKAAREKAAAEKAAAEKRAQEKAAAEKQAQEKAAKEKAAQEKAAAEKLAKEKAAAEKAAKEKAAKEKAAAEKAAAEKAAAEKAAKEKAAAEQALMQQLALEEAEAELRMQEEAERRAAAEAKAAETTAEYQDLIRARVAQQWSYPPNVTRNLEVTVRLVMIPTGEVISATVIKSSGHEALDRSVEQAIMKASPLPVPPDIQVFEQNFRNLTMKFRPENASW